MVAGLDIHCKSQFKEKAEAAAAEECFRHGCTSPDDCLGALQLHTPSHGPYLKLCNGVMKTMLGHHNGICILGTLTPVVRQVSMQGVAVQMGPSGSGKSTLLGRHGPPTSTVPLQNRPQSPA